MNSVHYGKRLTTSLLSLTMVFTFFAVPAKAENAGATKVEWKSIVFGQSTSSSTNKVTVDSVNNTVIVEAGTADGNAAGGKITGSHDGISYYYSEIDPSKNFELSAEVKVNFFAKSKPDNQEGFGIMARDAIGTAGDTTVFASNMVMVGGYKGQVQSVFRNKVEDASGAGAKMEDTFKFGERPANDGTSTYKMTLKKTNTGYQVSVDNSEEKIYYRPKALEVLNKDKIYVGFFAARVASITVSNIVLKTSDVATDPAGIPEPKRGTIPALTLASINAATTSNYDLKVLSNVKGNLVVKQAGSEIYNGVVEANNIVMTNTTLTSGDNTFEMVLTPEAGEDVVNTDTVNVKYVVTYKTFNTANGAVYVSPNGKQDGTGTEDDPADIYTAVKFITPGQTIYARGGKYNLTSPLTIERGNDGTADKLKVISAYPNERPVFDFGKKSNGFTLAGDAWKIYGIDVTNAASTGFRIAGNYNIAEFVNTYANGDTGLQISGNASEGKEKWPSHNLVLNCTSYDNRDASENNADGFAAKLTVGPGNVFRGCISHNNTDDGWDLYSKLESGAIEPVVIENSIAYGNGILSDGTVTKGDGNGFKMGGEGLAVKHLLRNSLSFNNRSTGVTSNSDPAIIVENTTSVDNGKANYDFAFYQNAKPQFAAKNNISFRTKAGTADKYPEYLASDNNHFYNGNETVNASGKKVTAADFKSVVRPEVYSRNADGTIVVGDYMVLVANSAVQVGARLSDFSNITNTAKKPATVSDNANNGKVLPKTGSPIGLQTVAGVGLVLVVIGAFFVVFGKRQKFNK